MAPDTFERAVTNCFACGTALDATRDLARHTPEPRSDDDRCLSRPRKYSHLRCMYAIGHECEHTAKVAGTGLTCWSAGDAV